MIERITHWYLGWVTIRTHKGPGKEDLQLGSEVLTVSSPPPHPNYVTALRVLGNMAIFMAVCSVPWSLTIFYNVLPKPGISVFWQNRAIANNEYI